LAETPGAIEAGPAGAARRVWLSACPDQTWDEVKAQETAKLWLDSRTWSGCDVAYPPLWEKESCEQLQDCS